MTAKASRGPEIFPGAFWRPGPSVTEPLTGLTTPEHFLKFPALVVPAPDRNVTVGDRDKNVIDEFVRDGTHHRLHRPRND